MDKRTAYLYERKYLPDGGETAKIPDKDKIQFWEQNIGADYFQKIYEQIPEIAHYIKSENYILKENTEAVRRVSEFAKEYKNINFISFYEPYLIKSLENTVLSKKVPILNREARQLLLESPKLCRHYFISLLQSLDRICIRILIHEMQTCKAQGLLEGADEKEEYQFFCRQIITEEWRKKLYEKYPLLERCVNEAVAVSVSFYAELFVRVMENKREIETKLCQGQPFQTISDMKGGMGDSHCGGRSVVKLVLDNGYTVIYKPHALDNERYMEKLLKKLGSACGMDMYEISRVYKAEYGFTACVEHKPCESEAEVQRFYRRIGISLFAFYLLGTNDLHRENIIAAGEYPVFVDMENIIGIPNERTCSNIMEKMNEFLQTSVLYSGMLPAAKWQQENGNVNISGLGGGGTMRLPFKIPAVAGGGTSNMRITYIYPKIEADQNMPVYNQKCAEPQQYAEEICEGFTRAYTYACEYKTNLRKLLEEAQELESRYLTSDTQRYSMCLNSSYHPSLMTDGADRSIYLSTMYYGRNTERTGMVQVIESEVRDLAMGDIPYFYFKVSKRHLYNSRGQEITDYFQRPAGEWIACRLSNLNEKDLWHQVNLIRLTLQPFGEMQINHILQKPSLELCVIPRQDTYLKLAEKYLSKVLERAVNIQNEFGWYTLDMASSGQGGWKIKPVHMYLYGGIMGIAVLCHLMYRYTGQPKYGQTAETLDAQLFAYTQQLESMETDGLRTGIYNGEMSISYGYIYLYQVTGEIKYLTYAKRHGDLILSMIDREENPDLLDGLAGILWGMIMLFEYSGENRYLQGAVKTGDKLCGMARRSEKGAGYVLKGEKVPLLGISHGNAGIAASLMWLYGVTKSEKYYVLAKELIDYENFYYEETLKNWQDFRVREETERKTMDTVAWCHGAGGILASRFMMEDVEDIKKSEIKELLEQDIQRAGDKLSGACLREGMCLCHGSCGNVLLLLEYEQRAKKGVAEGNKYDGYICGELQKALFQFLPQEYFNPGLMSGMSGIVFYMLKRHDNTLPNLLFLE